tara:strand:+ start:371 stop:805 length:435 start_codon:yes stop_codon:yes gene_type:complete
MEEENLMSWLKKTNGWQRLWLVGNSIFALLLTWWVLTNESPNDFKAIIIIIVVIAVIFVGSYALGLIVKMSLSNKSNGWLRLWLVGNSINALWLPWFLVLNSHSTLPNPIAFDIMIFMFFLLGASLGSYAIGIAISWIIKGFKG